MAKQDKLSVEWLRDEIQKQYDDLNGLVLGETRLTFAHAGVALEANKRLTRRLGAAAEGVDLWKQERDDAAE